MRTRVPPARAAYRWPSARSAPPRRASASGWARPPGQGPGGSRVGRRCARQEKSREPPAGPHRGPGHAGRLGPAGGRPARTDHRRIPLAGHVARRHGAARRRGHLRAHRSLRTDYPHRPAARRPRRSRIPARPSGPSRATRPHRGDRRRRFHPSGRCRDRASFQRPDAGVGPTCACRNKTPISTASSRPSGGASAKASSSFPLKIMCQRPCWKRWAPSSPTSTRKGIPGAATTAAMKTWTRSSGWPRSAPSAGLVLACAHKSPVPFANIVTTTTHKTLRGPRGAMILATEKGLAKDSELAQRVDRAVFPGLQGGPHDHTTAAIAVALGEALQPSFVAYGRQVVANAKALAQGLLRYGLRLVTGGTDNHMILLDLTPGGPGRGVFLQEALDRVGITVNKNTIPGEPSSAFYPSGIRLGTPAATTRGMREPEMSKIAEWIAAVGEAIEEFRLPEGREERATALRAFRRSIEENRALEALRGDVREFCLKFPVPGT